MMTRSSSPMPRAGRGLSLAALLLLSLTLIPCSLADDDKRAARERESLRRLQAEAQRLNSQLQTLEAERGKLSTEASAKEKALTETKSRLKEKEKAEKSLRGELKTRLAKARKDMEDLELKFGEVSGQLKDVTERNTRNEATLAARDAEIRDLKAKLAAQRDVIARQGGMLTESSARNRELAAIARDLMKRYSDKGVMDALLQKEPFTGIEKVRLQNRLREYEDKVDSQTLALPAAGG